MSTPDNKAIAQRAYEMLSSGNLKELDDIIDQNIVDHDPAPGQGPGLEGIKQVANEYHTAFPDVQMTVEQSVAEGDMVASRVTITGTHQGRFMGLPATEKQASFAAMDLVRIENGKIVERWGVGDAFGLFRQLGVISLPGQSD